MQRGGFLEMQDSQQRVFSRVCCEHVTKAWWASDSHTGGHGLAWGPRVQTGPAGSATPPDGTTAELGMAGRVTGQAGLMQGMLDQHQQSCSGQGGRVGGQRLSCFVLSNSHWVVCTAQHWPGLTTLPPLIGAGL